MPLSAGVFATDGYNYLFVSVGDKQITETDKLECFKNIVSFEFSQQLFSNEPSDNEKTYLHSCEYFVDLSWSKHSRQFIRASEILESCYGVTANQDTVIAVVKPAIVNGCVEFHGLGYSIIPQGMSPHDPVVSSDYVIILKTGEIRGQDNKFREVFTYFGIKYSDYLAVAERRDILEKSLAPTLQIE